VPLKRLQVQPGIVKDVTPYTAQGTWVDAQWVRFNEGQPQRMGGWSHVPTTGANAYAPRQYENALVWYDTYNSGQRRETALTTAVNVKLLADRDYDAQHPTNSLVDITPSLGEVAYAAVATFVSVINTKPVTVTLNAALPAGVSIGTVVQLVTPPATVGGIAIPLEVTVTSLASPAFTFDLPTEALSNESVNNPTGRAIFTVYDPLTESSSSGVYGAGKYGAGAYGTSSTSSSVSPYWVLDTYGQLLVATRGGVPPCVWCDVAGALPNWATGATPTARMIPLTSLTGTDGYAPTIADFIIASGVSRHIIVLGTNDTVTADYDPLLVRWCSQEDFTTWYPASTNTAGDFPLAEGSYIVAAVRLRREILIWTDTALYSMQYIGGQEVFSFQTLASNISIASVRSMAVHADTVYWMGTDKFYVYDGRVSELESPVMSYVLDDIATFESAFAGLNLAFNEVIWFYDSVAAAGKRYTTYNYNEKVWSTGTQARTMWYDTASIYFPLAANGVKLLRHESAVDGDNGDGLGAQPISAFIESSEMDVDDGENFSFVRRIIPDVNFSGSNASAPAAVVTLIPRRAPGSNVGSATTPANPVAATGGAITPYTERVDIRLRARQVRLRLDSSLAGVTWTLGTQRIDAQPDGKK
jgi:hypothetical protein